MTAESNRVLASCPVPATTAGTELPSTRELFKAHAGFVLRVARHLGVDPGDAEDVIQEVFMIAHQRLPALRSDANPRNWLFGITRRVAANHVRRSKRRRGVPIDDRDAIAHGTPATELQRLRDRKLLLEAFDKLSDAKREVFALFELEGLAMHDVAEMVGCPLHTAYSRLYAARAVVQQHVLAQQARSRR